MLYPYFEICNTRWNVSWNPWMAGNTSIYQFTWWCKPQVVRWCTSKHSLGSQQKNSYFALSSVESLLLFISFYFAVYMIENKEKGNLSFFHHYSKIYFLLIGCQCPDLMVTSGVHAPAAWGLSILTKASFMEMA